MDVLSDVIAAMKTGEPHSARTEHVAPWHLRFPPMDTPGFHVVLQGTCRLIPSSGEPIGLGAGDVVFLARESGHGLADQGPGHAEGVRNPSTVLLCGAYLLNHVRPHPLLAELPDIVHFPARVGRHTSLRTAVDLLGAELEQPRPGTSAIIPALLDMLLLYILRAFLEEQPAQCAATGWAAALADPAISKALHDIHAEPARAWTVADLGRRAGLSRAAFSRRFTALVGKPPLTYLTWWRMIAAARLLRDSDLPLRSVAEQTGYASEFAFAKAFKREYGEAPGQYRQYRHRRA